MKNRKTSERGVAILFSLGILGMMTVLALTFASVSMTNQTIAKNATEQLSAKEMARGIVDRIQYALANSGYTGAGSLITTPAQLRNLYSKESATATFDWIWKLGMTGTDIQSALYRTDEVCDYSASKPNNLPTWQYVKSQDGKILGRFAYVALAADLPVLDINSMFLKEDNTAADSSRGRLGNSLSEIDPNDVYKTVLAQLKISSANYGSFTDIDTNLVDRIKTALTAAPARRLSGYSDFEQFLPAMQSANKKEVSKVVANSYTPGSVKYPEIFLAETNLYAYRFDITQNETLKGMDAAARKQLVEKMVGEDSGSKLENWGSAGNTTKIPWLAELRDPNAVNEGYGAGLEDASKLKAKQIAANIVDFFSSGYEPVSDPLNWFGKNWNVEKPKYIGLKKTPYLFGVGGNIEFIVNQVPSEVAGSSPQSYTHALYLVPSFTPHFEMCNMYDMSAAESMKIAYEGSLSIDYTVQGESGTVTLELNTKSSPESVSVKKEKGAIYLVPTEKKEPANLLENKKDFPTPTANKFETYTVVVSKISFNLKVALQFNNNWVDFSEINHSTASGVPMYSDSANPASLTISSDTLTLPVSMVFRVADPRHNLFPENWKGAVSFIKVGNLLNYETILNDPSHNPMSQFAAFSTETSDVAENPLKNSLPGNEVTSLGGYLPQDTLQTPWEIGSIHRGAPWQTLNLKKFKETDPQKGGSYQDGDAGLLDQIRLTKDCYTYGKIPLNEIWDKNSIAVKILSSGAIFGGNEPSITPGINSYEYKDPTDKDISNFFKARKDASPYYFQYRGELAKVLSYNAGYDLIAADPATDAAKEELFAKSIMLFDVEPTFLPRRVYVFGIAQTIQDVVDGTVYKDWNGDGTFNAPNTPMGKYSAGYRAGINAGVEVNGAPSPSGTIAATTGRYDNGADRILSEQKIFAILEREYTPVPYTSTDKPKWKIVRFEYVQ